MCDMDLSLDPQPRTTELQVPPAAASSHYPQAANPTPSVPSLHKYPPYPEMITNAIASLKERDGSSKRAISKYIEAHYSDLPPAHSLLLSSNLKLLKEGGDILMVKHSYKLPRSVPAAPVPANSAVSVGQKKRPGRGPPKHEPAQAAIPVFVEQPMSENSPPNTAPLLQNAATGPLGSTIISTGPVSVPDVGPTTKRRGRFPKQSDHMKSGGVQAVVGRSRGRPPKVSATPVTARTSSRGLLPEQHGPGGHQKRGRGRPKKNDFTLVKGLDGLSARQPKVANVEGGVAVARGGLVRVAGKRRGRPTRAGSEVKKPRVVVTGEPKKTASAASSQTQVNQQQIVCLDLKRKLEYFQSRIKQTVSIIKPHLSNVTAITALQELETLAVVDVNKPLNIPSQS